MISFKEMLTLGIPTRKYARAVYDAQTQHELMVWCTMNGFDLGMNYEGNPIDPHEFVFHTTIIYSTNEVAFPDVKIKVRDGDVTPLGFDMLGIEKNVPVLKVKSDLLTSYNKRFKENYGMEEYWPEFKPHVSLSYNKGRHVDVSKLALPKFKLNIDYIMVTAQNAKV